MCIYCHTSGAGVSDRLCPSRCQKGPCEGQPPAAPPEGLTTTDEVRNFPGRAKVAERPESWNPRQSGVRLGEWMWE
jgi:hypothetical protein